MMVFEHVLARQQVYQSHSKRECIDLGKVAEYAFRGGQLGRQVLLGARDDTLEEDWRLREFFPLERCRQPKINNLDVGEIVCQAHIPEFDVAVDDSALLLQPIDRIAHLVEQGAGQPHFEAAELDHVVEKFPSMERLQKQGFCRGRCAECLVIRHCFVDIDHGFESDDVGVDGEAPRDCEVLLANGLLVGGKVWVVNHKLERVVLPSLGVDDF